MCHVSTGTGKGGRVTKGDVLERIASFSKETCADPLEERVPMTRLRQKIAQRLKGAQNTAAILTTFNEIDMGPVMEIRGKFKEKFGKKAWG